MPNFPFDSLQDPHIVHHFALEIQGISVTFSECSGLDSSNEVIEHIENDALGHQQTTKMPGRIKWGDVTLKRGVTDNMDLWTWRKQVIDGQIDMARKDASILMMDAMDQQIARVNLKRCWPSAYKSSDVKSADNSVMIETIVLAHEFAERA